MTNLHDLVVIGGGINGAALAELAAQNGYSVALLEKNDFGAGVTSRSTRLIHGGLRYLEHGQIGVVRESLREREALLEEFPCQVEPLAFLIPVYAADSRPRLWLRLGLEAYQFLGHSRLMGRHRQLSSSEVLATEPGLQPEGLRGGFLYFDCQAAYPERLALEMALSAEQHGAVVKNHATVEGLLGERSEVQGVRVAGGGEYRARLVVNAAGPWVDEIRRMRVDGVRPVERPLLSLLGGAHIVTGTFPGAPGRAIYHEASADRRPFFVIPWRGLWLIGTTEIPHDGRPNDVAPSGAEVQYLLRETNLLFPHANLGPGAVLYSYAGLRPLLHAASARPQEMSRGHAVYDHEKEEGLRGMITLVGGKLTTARALAAQALDVIGARLGRASGRRPAREGWSAEGIAPRLARIYGRRAEQIVSMGREWDRPICPSGETTAAEVLHAVRNEKAQTLGDILLRRTGAAFGPCLGLDCAPEVARLAAPLLGWDERGIEAALAAYREELDRTLYRGPW